MATTTKRGNEAWASFVTVDNLKHCETRFKEFMSSKYRVVIEKDECKQRLYRIMMKIHEKNVGRQDVTLRDLNNMTLNAAHAEYHHNRDRASTTTDRQQQPPQRVQQPQVLERDKQIFGDRRVVFNHLLPDASSSSSGGREQVSHAFEKLVDDRKDAVQDAQQRSSLSSSGPEKVDTISSDEFQARLQRMSKEREDDFARFVSATDSPPPPLLNVGKSEEVREEDIMAGTAAADALGARMTDPAVAAGRREEGGEEDDPRALAMASLSDQAAFRALQEEKLQSDLAPQQQQVLLEPPRGAALAVQERYLAMTSADRNWVAEPARYRYTASVSGYGPNDMQGTYKKVAFVHATRVVLPMEIVQPSNSLTLPKQNFNFEFSFSYPYLLLSIDEFDGVLDGTNESIRKAFCMFVYDTSYKAPNGRGYVLLKPASGELKRFQPPLAGLRDLRVSLLRPNGTLLNNSTDAYTVQTLQYDVQNRLYLRVIADQYFDRNEFYTGDYVRIRGFSAEAAPGAANPDTSAIAGLIEYMNRAQGHEIVQLGPANDQGFHKTFFILAPGVLDQGAGRVIIDERIVTIVQSLGLTTSTTLLKGKGTLLNMSLQNVVTLKLGVHVSELPAF